MALVQKPQEKLVIFKCLKKVLGAADMDDLFEPEADPEKEQAKDEKPEYFKPPPGSKSGFQLLILLFRATSSQPKLPTGNDV